MYWHHQLHRFKNCHANLEMPPYYAPEDLKLDGFLMMTFVVVFCFLFTNFIITNSLLDELLGLKKRQA